MKRDIEFSKIYEITMYKKLWAESELSLARCLNFAHNIEASTIICDLTVTNIVSILEFIKESFPNFWGSPMEVEHKNYILDKINEAYLEMRRKFDDHLLTKLGYEEKLYGHQKEALFLICKKKSNLLAYEMGTGKSAIASSLSKMLSVKRTLIICPASLKYTWKNELCGKIMGFNELYVSLLDANKARTIRAFQERFIICNYDSLEKHLPHILSSPIGHIIIDECVAVKSTSTNRYRQVDKIVKANPEAKVTLLSGAPIRNRVNDFYSYLKLTDHALGHNYAAFIREYTISSRGRGNSLRITGGKNLDKLWLQTSNFMIRKRKEECLDLPPKIYSRLYFSLDDYKSEYDAAVMEALEKSGKTNLNSCVHTINRVVSKSKIKGVIEFAESLLEQDEKVVIFSGYTDTVKELEMYFKEKCVLINGQVDALERSHRVDRFMTDDTCQIFIGNTLAAGTGLTLTVASNMVFCDFPFSPADLVQAEDRLHRISQTKPVNIFYAVCQDSIDDHLYQLIADKSADAAAVIDNSKIDMLHENIGEMLISKLREEYNVPEPISNGETKE